MEEIKEPEEYKLCDNEEVVCPYCGYEHTDSWEIGNDETETTCGNCDKKIGIEQEVIRTFTSYKTCQPGDEHTFTEWTPYPCGPILATRYCKVCRLHEYKRGDRTK